MKRLIILFLLSVIVVWTPVSLFGQTDTDIKRYDYYFLEAMMQRQKGNADATFELLRHCVDINPHAAESYYYLGQYYLTMRQVDKAGDCFRKAVELNSNNSTYPETLAQFYITENKQPEAIKAYEMLYEKDKSRVDILEILTRLYLNAGENEKAISTLERLEQADGKSERTTLIKRDVYTLMRDRKSAIAEMKSLADQYPNDLDYRAMLGDMYMLNEQENKALDIFRSVLSKEPNNLKALKSMRAYYLLVDNIKEAEVITHRLLSDKDVATEEKVFLLRQEIEDSERNGGDSTKILQHFRYALSVPEPDANLAMFFAAYMDLKKMPQDSIEPVLNKVLELAPDNAAARLQLISYAFKTEDADKIITLCQPARQYNPDEMAFYYYQGMAYYHKHEDDMALATFKNGVDVVNKQSDARIVADMYVTMGDILQSKGEKKEAYAAYDSCLVWAPDHIGCLNNYAYFLSVDGKNLDKAEQMSYKTIKAEPNNATYLDTYAWILFMQKRFSEAKIYIEQALRNDSALGAVVVEHAGDIYAVNGATEQAVECWKQALDKNPENKVLIRKIKLKKYIKE